jgi:hypothetical protein
LTQNKETAQVATEKGMWTKPSDTQPWTMNNTSGGSFDMRQPEQRFTYVDITTGATVSGSTPSQHGSATSGSVPAMSMESSPNIATPESIQQNMQSMRFDPDKFFDMAMHGNGVDVGISIGQGMNDDDGVEFFTDMLGVNLNGN